MIQPDPEPRPVEPTGNARVDALIDALVCPSCRTIYNAAKAKCADLWHYDNRPLATGGTVETVETGPVLRYDGGCVMPTAEFRERLKAAMATQRVTVLPPSESEREQAAHARGVAEGRALRAEQLDAATRGAYEDGKGDGRAEGRRQATEGRELAWGVRMEWVQGPMTLDCVDRATAEDYIAALPPSQRGIASVVSRLVGPWEAAEQAAPVCTCPQIDVTLAWEKPGSRTVRGRWDPACPVCPKPVREGEALGVTDEQRADLHKHFGDMRDRIGVRRQQRAEQGGDGRG